MKRLGLGLALTATVVLGFALPAGATAPTAAGWWWAAQSAPEPLPAPPTVPDGGLMVASDPSGGAVAALRFTVPADQTSPVMTLSVADNGDINGATAIITAYPATSKWKATSAGNWAERPQHTSFPFVKGKRSADGLQWSFDLTQFVSDHVVDVVLVADSGSNFQLTFNAPSATTLKTTPVPSATATPEPEPYVAPAELSNDVPAVTDIGAVPAYTPPVQEVALDVAPPRAQRPAAISVPRLPAASNKRAPGIVFLLLLGIGLAAYGLMQAPTPPVRGLGPMSGAAVSVPALRRRAERAAEPQVGGLGRFARVRYGPPPKL